jgi:acyl-CoA synthetase (AMP-forming)/AMP-acid ligase II
MPATPYCAVGSARARRDAEALVSSHQGIRYTYAEFGEAVDRLAGGMLAAGLGKGDRVGVPMTVAGKLQKFKMREAAIEELGLAKAAAIATA